jgi:hypothetical protein
MYDHGYFEKARKPPGCQNFEPLIRTSTKPYLKTKVFNVNEKGATGILAEGYCINSYFNRCRIGA